MNFYLMKIWAMVWPGGKAVLSGITFKQASDLARAYGGMVTTATAAEHFF